MTANSARTRPSAFVWGLRSWLARGLSAGAGLLVPSGVAAEEAHLVGDDPLADLLHRALGNRTGKLRVADAFLICGIEPGKANQDQIHRFGRAIRELGWERQLQRFDGDLEYAYVKGTPTERAVELIVEYDPHMRSSWIETKERVTDYLSGRVWDNIPRLDRWLVDYAGALDTPYSRAVGRMILTAGVRRARHPGCRMDTLPILCGPQGCGKSEALHALAVKDSWFTQFTLPAEAPQRQVIEDTAGKWFVEMDDFSPTPALKAFLSRTYDEARLPYQQLVSRVPRSFLVVGTTNQMEIFLAEAPGNRRLWPVDIQYFNLEKLRADRDQLWAEAVVVEAEGHPLTPPSPLEMS